VVADGTRVDSTVATVRIGSGQVIDGIELTVPA
jgi:hypothetical protein